MNIKFLLALSIGFQCFGQNMDVNEITVRIGMGIIHLKHLSQPP